MAASFASASSQYLLNSTTPFTAFPFSVGVWVYPLNTSVDQDIWLMTNSNASADAYELRQVAATNNWRVASGIGGGASTGLLLGTVIPNVWAFMIARWISTTNRRLALLNADGSVQQGADTTSNVPTTFTVMALGARYKATPDRFFNGKIAEYWLTNSDVQGAGADLDEGMVRQLAYGGPFSVPHIAKDIVEYRSLRKDPRVDEIGETAYGQFGQQTYVNTNGVTIGDHPPLPYWFERPGQRRVPLVT